MAFQCKYVSPEIPKVWEKTDFSIFLLLHLSQNACSKTPVRFASSCDVLRGWAPPIARWQLNPLENRVSVPPSHQLHPTPAHSSPPCYHKNAKGTNNVQIVLLLTARIKTEVFMYPHHQRMWRPSGLTLFLTTPGRRLKIILHRTAFLRGVHTNQDSLQIWS